MEYRIIHADSGTALPDIPAGTVDLVVTSPPYRRRDGYSEDMIIAVFRELQRVLRPDSLCFVVFGHLAENKSAPYELHNLVRGVGFRLRDTICWKKNHFAPVQGSRNLNNLWEFVLGFQSQQEPPQTRTVFAFIQMFSKGRPRLDRLSVGVPYADPSNAARFNRGQNLRCAGNFWEIPHATIQRREERTHPHEFPLELPARCIRLSGIAPGSTVLDPFMGGGTTLEAALCLGMNAIGIDRSGPCCRAAERRLRSFMKERMIAVRRNLN